MLVCRWRTFSIFVCLKNVLTSNLKKNIFCGYGILYWISLQHFKDGLCCLLTMFPMRNMLSSISLFLYKCVISYCFTDFLFVAGFEQFDSDISLFIYPVIFFCFIFFLKFEHFSAFISSNTFASLSQFLLHNSQKHISLLTLWDISYKWGIGSTPGSSEHILPWTCRASWVQGAHKHPRR